jgi:hypothetical protein
MERFSTDLIHESQAQFLSGDAVQRFRLAGRDVFSQWAITASDADARIARALLICVGNEIRKTYSDVPDESLPPKLRELLSLLGR